MKIGIFGGCFNPPHNMHKEIAEELIEKGYVDKVIFAPTGNNYNKRDLIDISERITMLKLMNENESIEISDICKENKYQYTYQVLDFFKTNNLTSQIYFICGTDNLDEFETWKNYEYILERYKLLIIKRNNDNIDALINRYFKFKENIEIANIEQNPVSSTIIRKSIKQFDFDSLKKYMDKNVLEYIKQKGLYKE